MKCLIQQFENDPYDRMGSDGIAVPDSQWFEDIDTFEKFLTILCREDEPVKVLRDAELYSFFKQRYDELAYNRPVYFIPKWYGEEGEYLKDWINCSDYFFITPLEK